MACYRRPHLVDVLQCMLLYIVEAVVETDAKFAEAIIYALCNVCTNLHLSKEETVDVVNAVCLGDTGKSPMDQKLKLEDFTRHFPKNTK